MKTNISLHQMTARMLAALLLVLSLTSCTREVTVLSPLVPGYPTEIRSIAAELDARIDLSNVPENAFIAVPLRVRTVVDGTIVYVALLGTYRSETLMNNPAKLLMDVPSVGSYRSDWILVGDSRGTATALEGLSVAKSHVALGYDMAKDETEFIGESIDGRRYFIVAARSSRVLMVGSSVFVLVDVDAVNDILSKRDGDFTVIPSEHSSAVLSVE